MGARPRNRAGFLTLKTMLKPLVRPDAKKPKSKVATWIVGASVLIAALALVVLLWPSEPDEPPAPPSAPPATPRKRTLAETKTNTTSVVRTNVVRKAVASLGYEDGVEILSLTARTNTAGAVIEKLKLADGTIKMKVSPKPPLFENACDQVIAMAISTKPGDAMPPLPDLTGIEEDFANSLLSPIRINDDDSDEVKLIKEQVIEVRKELAQTVKNGGSVMEALLAHQDEMNRIYESRLTAIQMMQRIQAESGIEAAQEFADEVNRRFESENIPAIPVVGRGRQQQGE